MAQYYGVRLIDKQGILDRNPQFKGDISVTNNGYPYYFWGMSGTKYMSNQLAMCSDIFHSTVTTTGQFDSNLADYVGEIGEREIVYTMHMEAMLAEQAEIKTPIGPQQSIPILFHDPNKEK